jgi:hypothetical protein
MDGSFILERGNKMAANYIDLMKKKPFIGPKLPNVDYTNGLKATKDQSNIADQGNGTVHATTVTTPDKPSEPVFKAPAAFSYDANNDPSYQAALRQAQQGAQTATNNAMVSLGSRGIGNSSIAVDRGNQIQQKAIGNVNDTILPQLMSQAYGRYQDQNNNDYRNALANYNVGRDQVGDNHWQTTRDDGRTDIGNNLAVNVGQLTGDYISPENAKNQAEMLANSAAWKGASPEEQQKLHDRNMILSQMMGKTYNKQTGTYSEGTGTRTIQGQQLDSQVKEVAYSHARDSLLDKRYEKEFKNNVEQQGLDYALKKALQAHQITTDNAQIAISRQNANTSSSNASWARDANNPDNVYKNAQIDKLKNPTAADAKIDPKSSAEAYANYKDQIDNSTHTKEQKLAFAASVSGEMTASDYANLVKGIK